MMLERRAYHEAGHCIAARHYSWTLRSVKVKEDKGVTDAVPRVDCRGGKIQIDRAAYPTSEIVVGTLSKQEEELARQDAIITLCGVRAEEKHNSLEASKRLETIGRPFLPLPYEDKMRLDCLTDAISKSSGKSESDVFEELDLQANRIVDDHWKDLEALARELIEKREIVF